MMMARQQGSDEEQSGQEAEGQVTPLDAARDYARRGWAPVPVPYRERAPRLPRWHDLRLSEGQLTKYFDRHAQNVGVLLGAPSGGLVDVELSAPEALALADLFLPETGCVIGPAGRRRGDRLYVADPLVTTVRCQDTDPSTRRATLLVALRSSGAQALMPPSVLPDGEPVLFDADGIPAVVDGRQLRAQVARLGGAALLLRAWPARRQRAEAARALATGLLDAGWSDADVTDLILAIARAVGDAGTARRARSMEFSGRTLDSARHGQGWAHLAALLGPNIVRRVREGLDIRARPAAGMVRPAHTRRGSAAGTGSVPAEAVRMRELDDAAIERQPAVSWLIDGIMPRAGLTVLTGRSGSFRSFVTLDWSLSIATGRSWNGRSVSSGSVVYAITDGGDSIGGRVRAWKQASGFAGRAGVRFVPGRLDLRDPVAVEAFLAHLAALPERPVLVVIDSLAHSLPSGDDTHSDDLTLVLAAIERIRGLGGAAVLVIESGQGSTETAGSTALSSVANAVIGIDAQAPRVMLRCIKQRDAAAFTALLLRADVVTLGESETSCVLRGGEPADDGGG